MKKTSCFLLGVILLAGCSKGNDPAPQETEYEMSYHFTNISNTVLPIVEMQAIANYPNESNTHSILLNKMDLDNEEGFEIKLDGTDHTVKTYEGCRVWQIIHVRQQMNEQKYLETVWVTPSHLITKDKATHQLVFNWPADTIRSQNVVRTIKRDIQDVEKIYPIYFYK